MFKNLICSSILVLKWRQVSPKQLELQLAQVNFYTRKDFKSLGIGYLYEKQFLILNELKTSLMLKLSLQDFLQIFEKIFLMWFERLPRIFIFGKIEFNVFYVIMKGVPIIRNFKRPIYQTFN